MTFLRFGGLSAVFLGANAAVTNTGDLVARETVLKPKLTDESPDQMKPTVTATTSTSRNSNSKPSAVVVSAQGLIEEETGHTDTNTEAAEKESQKVIQNAGAKLLLGQGTQAAANDKAHKKKHKDAPIGKVLDIDQMLDHEDESMYAKEGGSAGVSALPPDDWKTDFLDVQSKKDTEAREREAKAALTRKTAADALAAQREQEEQEHNVSEAVRKAKIARDKSQAEHQAALKILEQSQANLDRLLKSGTATEEEIAAGRRQVAAAEAAAGITHEAHMAAIKAHEDAIRAASMKVATRGRSAACPGVVLSPLFQFVLPLVVLRAVWW